MSSVHSVPPYLFKIRHEVNYTSTLSLSFGLFLQIFPAEIIGTSDVKRACNIPPPPICRTMAFLITHRLFLLLAVSWVRVFFLSTLF